MSHPLLDSVYSAAVQVHTTDHFSYLRVAILDVLHVAVSLHLQTT